MVTDLQSGIFLACAAGLLFGFAFDPSQFIMDNETGATQVGLFYVFPQFSGIFFASTVWLMVYCGERLSPRLHAC